MMRKIAYNLFIYGIFICFPFFLEAKEPQLDERNKKMNIIMKTSMGDIQIELNKEKAPKTVSNFLGYVKNGHYSDTIFHRVIDGFMIQGGGFTIDMNQKTAKDTVENEANNGLKNDSGTISMARTMDPHSASSQFFINVNDNNFLNYPGQDGWGYCVFGKVIEGMDIVNKIKEVNTKNMGPHQNVPVDPIIIQSIELAEQG